MNKALFLDRDGVINKDFGHVWQIKDFHFVEGIFELCVYFQAKGYLIIIITNQAGIAKGYYNIRDFNKLTKHMIREFKKQGIIITDIFYEPSADDNNPRRKPNVKMFIEAAEKHNIDFSQSIMIGDKESDMMAAFNANIPHLFLLKGRYNYNNQLNFVEAESLKEIKDMWEKAYE